MNDDHACIPIRADGTVSESCIDKPTLSLFVPPFPASVCLPSATIGDEQRNSAIAGSPLERAKYVERILIDTDAFAQATKAIETLIERSGSLKQPGGLCITGDGGTGKTFIGEFFVKKHPREDTALRSYCPVLLVKMESTPNPRQFVASILNELKYQSVHDNQSAPELKNILLKALPACGVKIVFFDEAHHLIPTSGSRKNKERLAGDPGDFAKGIYDGSAIPFVWMGRPSLGELFDADSQLSSRWAGRVELQEFKFDEQWNVTLDVIDEALPMEEKSGLADPAMAALIYESSSGNFRRLKGLLSECVRIAVSDSRKKITDGCVRKARYALALGPKHRS